MRRATYSPPRLAAALTLVVIASSFSLPVFAAMAAAQGTGATVDPVIRIYLLVSPGAMRQSTAQVIANCLSELGIQAQVISADWATINGRAFSPAPSMIGKTYEQGGFDALLTDWLYNPDPNPYPMFHSSQMPPTGQNYYLWNNTMADMLAYNMTRVIDRPTQLQCAEMWQEVAYEELPSIAICYDHGVVAFRPNLNSTPFEACYYPRWPGVERWSFTSSPMTSVTVAQPGACPYWGLTPYHSNYYSDMTGYAPIYGELGAYGLLIRSLNSTLMEPYMAYGNYTMSPDGRNWTFWIRPGIRFHNGEELDARDVAYTYRYVMTPSWNSGWYSYVKGILGANSSVYWAGESGTAGAGMPYNKFEVHFDLPQPWAFFQADIGGGAILPASVIVNSSSGIPDLSAWNPDPVGTAGFVWTSFVTGSADTYWYYAKNGTQYTSSGPMGAGPYKWSSYDPNTETVHLIKFDGYFNKAVLEAGGAFGITDYYVKHIADAYSAISCLTSNTVQVLDSSYHLGTYVASLDPGWSRIISYQGYQVTELGFNMRHPILGTGLGTPLGITNASMAAEAAKHVRHALEYLIPKDQIISSILNGYGEPGLTPPIMRSMPGFNYAITPRNGTLSNVKVLAMNELEAAGYTFIQGQGYWPNYDLLIITISLVSITFASLLLGVGLIRRRSRLNADVRGQRGNPRIETPISQPETLEQGEPEKPIETSVPRQTTMPCPRCGAISRDPAAQYCKYCGALLGGGSRGMEIQAKGRTFALKGRCMVCNLPIGKSDEVVWCPRCGNAAHRTHLLEWLHVKSYCPVCRAPINQRDLLSSRD
ncbi:MAG: ABC transporter substrate-binding protein [Promethearchaeati archaeon SRVP18_Atabeyarchaeia-1]